MELAEKERKNGKIRAIPKYKQLDLQEKLVIIDLSSKGVKNSIIAEEFCVSKSTVSRIILEKDKYQLPSPKKSSYKKRTRIDEGKNLHMQKSLFKWIKQVRSLGIPISGPLIQEKALHFNKLLNGPDNFKASKGWLSKFKARYGIRQLSIQGERLSADTAGGAECAEEIRRKIEELGIPLDNVYNADETGLYSKTLSERTLVTSDEKQAPGYKECKERVTVMNCSNATASHKIPLMVIGKSQRPRCFKGITNLPVIYRGQTSAWMNGAIFLDWFKNVFAKAVKERKPGRDEKFLLILDNAPCHPSAEKLNAIDPQIIVLYLCPNVTSILQPMDQGVIECMKRIYKKNFLRKLVLCESEGIVSIQQYLKNWNLFDTVSTISAAWSHVPTTALRKAWKRLLGEPLLISDSNEEGTKELASMFSRFPGSNLFSEQEIEEWIQKDKNAPAWHQLSDLQIVQMVTGPDSVLHEAASDVEEDDELVEEDASILEEILPEKDVDLKEMYASLIKFKKWYGRRPECSQEEAVHLNRMQSVVESSLYNMVIEKNV